MKKEDGEIEIPNMDNNDRSGDECDDENDESMTWDLSTTATEATIDKESENESLLRIDSKGVCGCMEKIPIGFKLLFTQVSMIGMLVIAGFLIAIQVKTITQTNNDQQFVTIATQIGNLISALQSERDLTNTLLYTSGVNYTLLDPLYQTSDSFISLVNSTLQGDYPVFETNKTLKLTRIQKQLTIFESYLIELQGYRQSINSTFVNPVSIFDYYTSLIHPLLVLLQVFASEVLSPVAFSLSNIVNLFEAQQSVKTKGSSILLAQRETQIDARTVAMYIAVRNAYLDQFLSTGSQDEINYYNNLLPASTFNYILQVEGVISPTSRPIPFPFLFIPSIFNNALWTNATDILNSAIKHTEEYITNKMISNINQNAKSATSLIIGIIIAIVVFLLISIIIPAINFYTIIGPWRRMNSMISTIVNKLIPNRMIQLIGTRRIMDVALGQSRERDAALLTVVFRNFDQATSKMNQTKTLAYFNELSEAVTATASRYGVVQQFTRNGFIVLSNSAAKAAQIAISLKHRINWNINDIVNRFKDVIDSDFMLTMKNEPLLLSNIHYAKYTFGIVGDNSRMQPTVIGKEIKISDMLSTIAEEFGCELLVTENGLKKMGKSFFKDYERRVVGMVNAGKWNNVIPMFVYEIVPKNTLKANNAKIFSKSINKFYKNKFYDTIKTLKEIKNNNGNNKDKLVEVYLEKSTFMIEECKRRASVIEFAQVIKDKDLLLSFETYCKNNHCLENLNFWKQASVFKNTPSSDRLRIAKSIYNCFIDEASEQCININREKRINIANTILGSNEPHISSDLFDPIVSEIEYLMSGTWGELKKDPFVVETIMSSTNYSPMIPLLNNFV